MGRPGQALRSLVALLAVATVAAVLGATPAAADTPADEAVFVASINQARQARGLPALTVDARLSQLGEWWSTKMAAAGDISHNPDLDTMVPAGWSAIGENVGEGPTPASVVTALLNSPHHFENMIDPDYTAVGVGVVRAAGTVYVTEDFYAGSGVSPAQAPAPVPVVDLPRASTTTAPPTTAPAARPTTRPVSATPAPRAAAPKVVTPAPRARRARPSLHRRYRRLHRHARRLAVRS